MASTAAASSVRESQQTIAELFGRFSDGMQQLLRAGVLSEPDQESIQRTTEIVNGVAQRCLKTAHQSITLEQRSIEHLRKTVEMLLPLQEREVMLAERELSALCVAAKILRMDLQGIFPSSSSSASHPISHIEEISDADLAHLISIFGVEFDHENPTFKEKQQACFEKVLEACKKKEWTKIEACKRSLATLRNQSGQTIFLYAVSLGKTKLIQTLIEKGIASGSKDREGNTALHLAAVIGDVELFRKLLNYISIVERNNQGQTPLHKAILSGQARIVEAIAANVKNLSSSLDWESLQLTPLALAALRGEIACVHTLLAKVSISNADTSIGNILHLVVYLKQNEMLEDLLIHYWKDCEEILEKPNTKGLTPLALAVLVDNPQAVFLLKKREANLEAEDHERKRPLHLAALTDSHPMVEILVGLGCTIDPRASGKTPCDLAPEGSPIKALLGNLMEQAEADRSAEPQFLYRPPQNLVFKGGGAKGIAYIGALQALRKENIFGEVQRFAGTSAGSIIATFLAMNFSLEELEELLSTTDLTTFLDHPLSSTEKVKGAIKKNVSVSSAFKLFSYIFDGIKSPINFAIEPLKAMFKELWSTTGICEGEAFRSWIDAKIEKKTEKKNCTFGEFQQLILQGRGFKHLHIFAMQLSALEVFHFNSYEERWKNLVISSAVTASMSIPFVFKPVVLKVKEKEGAVPKPWGDLGTFVDGGVLCSFPIEAFDQKRYISSGGSEAEGLCPMFNKRTLGFNLVSPQENIPEPGSIETVGDLAIGLIKAFRHAESILRQMNSYNQHRVIEIDSKGIRTLDFKLSATQRSDLILSGQQATLDFFGKQKGVHSASLFHMPKPAEVKGFHALDILPEFVGRKELLSKIHAALSKQPVLLYGHGGVGKSELALAYANEHRSEYSLIFSLRAETPDTLEQSYRELAKLLGVFIENLKPKKIIEKVHSALEAQQNWLLIYDNVATTIPLPKGKILLTSRQPLAHFSPETLAVEVLLFTEDEAVELLQKITGEDKSDAMHQLAARLGCYPLILGQIARYIKRNAHLDIPQYLEDCVARGLGLVRMEANERYQQTAEGIFVSLLNLLNPLDLQWLQICSQLNPDGIPGYFLSEWLEKKHPDIDSDKSRDDIIENLSSKLTILRFNRSGKTFSMHRIFQEILKLIGETQDGIGPKSSYNQACKLLVILWGKIDFESMKDWGKTQSSVEELYVHSIILIHDPRFDVLSPDDQALFYAKVGMAEERQGKYESALTKYQKTLEIGEGLPSKPLDKAMILNNIGRCHNKLGQTEAALVTLKIALATLESSREDNTLAYANILINIGICNYHQDDHDLSFKRYQRALDIQIFLLRDHPDTALSHERIGYYFFSQKKYKDALSSHSKALEMRKRITSGQDHPNIAASLNNMGNCHQYLEEFEVAFRLHQKALKIWRKTLSPNHPDIALGLNSIASDYALKGCFKEAIEFLQQACEIAKRSHGEDHKLTQGYTKRLNHLRKIQGSIVLSWFLLLNRFWRRMTSKITRAEIILMEKYRFN
ncbi:MAG: Photosystem I assembly protein Ycf3 [Chlamydiae bacterium]|nr:Photosystem I assembly protein Ycf3 [Chlamydiota bacterium]